jgi:hypothetical protein
MNIECIGALSIGFEARHLRLYSPFPVVQWQRQIFAPRALEAPVDIQIVSDNRPGLIGSGGLENGAQRQQRAAFCCHLEIATVLILSDKFWYWMVRCSYTWNRI